MAEESSLQDLNYGLARDRAVVSDDDVGDNSHQDNTNYNQVPDEHVEMDDNYDENNVLDYASIKAHLDQAGKDYGITVTKEMENYVMSIAATMEMTPDSLGWFMAAISYQNNMKTIPAMISLVEDMRTEIKTLQNTNRTLSVTSTDIVKKMTSVKDDILSSFEGLRRSVLDKIVAIPAQIQTAVSNQVPRSETKDKGKGIADNQKSIPPAPQTKKWVEVSSVVPSTSRAVEKEPKGSKESPDSKISALRDKCLIKAGVGRLLLSNMPDSMKVKLLSSADMMILMEDWESPRSKEIIENIEINVMMIEENIDM
uniref:P n=1 Tax=Lotus corniculatus virus 1 TaxID=2793731 RepID=A0A8D9PGX0_9RHAB|nr:TPA_asm: P [Lotus corniculatus virus 1]